VSWVAKPQDKVPTPFHWEQYTANVTAKKLIELARWRGLSLEYAERLQREQVIRSGRRRAFFLLGKFTRCEGGDCFCPRADMPPGDAFSHPGLMDPLRTTQR
jgi:hypothetical protein